MQVSAVHNREMTRLGKEDEIYKKSKLTMQDRRRPQEHT
jgi:hypothetical protein